MASIKGFKWVRPIQIERWVDGDTFIGLIDRGDGDFYRPKKGIRLMYHTGFRWDAPEVKTDPQRAAEARDAAAKLCPVGQWFVSTSHELDVYGRPLCSIRLSEGGDGDLAATLAWMGHAK